GRLRRFSFTAICAALLLNGCQQDTGTPTVTFPDNFLWGTASAAWQVEGDVAGDGLTTYTSNWTIWTREMDGAGGETNDRGAGFYSLYREDLDRHAAMGLNAIRLSIDWARVEPQPDVWNDAALDHYVDVIRTARSLGQQVMITFWHWVVPTWVSDPRRPAGDPARDQLAVPYNTWLHAQFADFVSHVVSRIGADVDLYSVLNEPWSVIAGAYVAGVHPPGELLDIEAALDVHANLIFMLSAAARAIREVDTVDADGDGRAALIGVAKASSVILPFDADNALDVAGAHDYNYLFNSIAIDAWTSGQLDVNGDGDTADTDTTPPEGFYPELENTLDWIGIQYYGPIYVRGFDGEPPFTGLPVALGLFGTPSDLPFTEMGSQIRPAVYFATIEYFWNRYRLPIYLTENGTADCDGNQRPRHTVDDLYAVGRGLAEGIDIRGYFHWSLTDNFEWQHGTTQCFGLYAVDYETLARTPRPTVDVYARIVREQRIDRQLLEEAYSWGYDGDQTGWTLDDWLAEIEAEVANGVTRTATYRYAP
ncbi:MAG: glycoside hydrolase family 1 protein, partial [Candidatus Dadabacteria bacterium]